MNRVQLSQRSSPIFSQPAQVAPTCLKQGTEEFLREKYFSEDRVNYLEGGPGEVPVELRRFSCILMFHMFKSALVYTNFSTEILILSTFSVFHSSRFLRKK
ncbi:uncharacterised protein [Saccharolobus solfataricus]|uniref:Uncharacterized protein n=1 Tax=Saccharolobus solfataricus TaxID=2287 RepID=A0A157T755_SACSO|nr:uncharacterised protein [Saccharolobus solfataricus]